MKADDISAKGLHDNACKKDVNRTVDSVSRDDATDSYPNLRARASRKHSDITLAADLISTPDHTRLSASPDSTATFPIFTQGPSKSANEDKSFRCDNCDKSYKYLKDLNRHNKESVCARSRPSREVIWKCSRCGAVLSNQYSVQRHIDTACWKNCDECCAEGNHSCDSTKTDSDCTQCQKKQRPCTKRTEAVEGSTVIFVPKKEANQHEDQAATVEQYVVVKKRNALKSPEAAEKSLAKTSRTGQMPGQEAAGREDELDTTDPSLGILGVASTAQQPFLDDPQTEVLPPSGARASSGMSNATLATYLNEKPGHPTRKHIPQQSTEQMVPGAETRRSGSGGLAHPYMSGSLYPGNRQISLGRGMFSSGSAHLPFYQDFQQPNFQGRYQEHGAQYQIGEFLGTNSSSGLRYPTLQQYRPHAQPYGFIYQGLPSLDVPQGGQHTVPVLGSSMRGCGTLRTRPEDPSPTQAAQRPPPDTAHARDKKYSILPIFEDENTRARDTLTPAPTNSRPSTRATTPSFLPNPGIRGPGTVAPPSAAYSTDRLQMHLTPSAPPTRNPDDPILTLRIGRIDGGRSQPFDFLQLRRSQPFGPYLNNYCEKAGKRYLFEWNFVYYYRAPTREDPKRKKPLLLKWNTKPNDVKDARYPDMRMKDGDPIYIVVRKDRTSGGGHDTTQVGQGGPVKFSNTSHAEPLRTDGNDKEGLNSRDCRDQLSNDSARKKQPTKHEERFSNDMSLQDENERLRAENETLRKENADLRREVAGLREQASDYSPAMLPRTRLATLGDHDPRDGVQINSQGSDVSTTTGHDDSYEAHSSLAEDE